MIGTISIFSREKFQKKNPTVFYINVAKMKSLDQIGRAKVFM